MILQAVLQDVFDTDLKEELNGLYKTRVWSDLSAELKDKMKEKIRSNLIACNIEVL